MDRAFSHIALPQSRAIAIHHDRRRALHRAFRRRPWPSSLAAKLWLARRQIRLRRSPSRQRCLARFADRIALAAHHKAADYTVARERLSRVDTLVEAALLVAAHPRRRLGACSSRGPLRCRLGAVATDVALVVAVAIVAGLIASAVLLVAHVRDRGSASASTGPRAPRGSPTSPRAPRSPPRWAFRCSALVLWLMRARGRVVVAVGVARVDGVPVPRARALSRRVIAPLFNKFSPLPEAGGARPRSRRCSRAAASRAKGLFVMDGSQALEPRQRVLHRLRPRASASCSSTRCSTRLAPERDRGRARARARPFQAPARAQAHGLVAVVSLGRPRAARLARRPAPWFYAGLGVPASRRRAPASRSCCSCSRCRCSRSLCGAAGVAVLAPARVRGGRLRRPPCLRAALVAALVKLYEDNATTLTPDPAAFGVLRFASAGGAAHRAPRGSRPTALAMKAYLRRRSCCAAVGAAMPRPRGRPGPCGRRASGDARRARLRRLPRPPVPRASTMYTARTARTPARSCCRRCSVCNADWHRLLSRRRRAHRGISQRAYYKFTP